MALTYQLDGKEPKYFLSTIFQSCLKDTASRFLVELTGIDVNIYEGISTELLEQTFVSITTDPVLWFNLPAPQFLKWVSCRLW